jgi:hypothetical protein
MQILCLEHPGEYNDHAQWRKTERRGSAKTTGQNNIPALPLGARSGVLCR